MAKVIIRNPMIYHTGPMTAVAYTESEMSYFCIEENVDKLIKYAGTSGVFENGAYYKVVADPVIPEEPDSGGNLLSEPIVVENFANDQMNIVSSYVNTEVGKTYKVEGVYGAGATAFDFTATCMDASGARVIYNDESNLIGGVLVCSILSAIEDGQEMSGVQLALYGEDDIANFSPFTINSIVEVEASASGNLLKETLSYNDNDSAINQVNDYALGLEIGKTYKIEGTSGADSTPFSVTAKGIDYHAMVVANLEGNTSLTEEIWAKIHETDGIVALEFNFDSNTIPTMTKGSVSLRIMDKAVARDDFDMPKYSDNGSSIYVGEELAGGDFSPLIINSITEA